MKALQKTNSSGVRTLAIDIGGTGVKSVVLDEAAKPLSDFSRVKTPRPATPAAVFAVIKKLAQDEGAFDRVAVGFPGVVHNGVVLSAHNLHKKWVGFKLQSELAKALGKPARAANDAAVQGLAAISGKGIEMVITLGTGMGSALYVNGQTIPLELAHHPFRHAQTYEEQLGIAAEEKVGRKRWNARVQKAIRLLEKTFNYDRLYIGGGNAKKINFKPPRNAKLIENADGLYGAVALWKQDPLR